MVAQGLQGADGVEPPGVCEPRRALHSEEEKGAGGGGLDKGTGAVCCYKAALCW